MKFPPETMRLLNNTPWEVVSDSRNYYITSPNDGNKCFISFSKLNPRSNTHATFISRAPDMYRLLRNIGRNPSQSNIDAVAAFLQTLDIDDSFLKALSKDQLERKACDLPY